MAGLRVHKAALLPPAPLLSACAVAVPKLKRRSAGCRASGDVHTLVEHPERAVAAIPGPALRARPVAGEKLNRSAVVCARAGVVDAFAGGAEDWTRATILRLCDGGRVEVVTGVDRLREAEVLALGPVERSGAASRPACGETSNVGPVPGLLGHEIAVVRCVGHRLQVEIGRTAVREFVFPTFPRKDRPEPSVMIGSMDELPPGAVAIALAIVVVIVSVEVDVAVGHRDLDCRVAVRCGGGRG